MKTPYDAVKGRIVNYDERTHEMTIVAKYDDVFTMLKRDYQTCLVQLEDSRPLSDKQRRMCYALLNDIADYSGATVDQAKEWTKIKFLVEDMEQTADQIFSLSNAPMSLVCAYQNFLIDFILSWDIPCSRPLLEIVDDVESYVYSCLVNKKCCICGQHSDLHHCDHVGMGRNREEIVHEGMRVLPLCRKHHNEVHSLGQESFEEKYHLTGGIVLDKALCKVYKLKTKKELKIDA